MLLAASAPKLPAQQNHWGRYLDEPLTKHLPDGRNVLLLSDFRYVDPSGTLWIAPAGEKVNGASIPRALWTVIGGPFEGKYLYASILHDVACKYKTRPSKEVHKMFYTAMMCSGENEFKAKTMYFAVLHFGPTFPQKSWVWEALKGKRYRLLNEQDVVLIREWVRTSNPSLAQIEAVEDGQLPLQMRPHADGGLSYHDPATGRLVASSVPELDSQHQPTGRIQIYSSDGRLIYAPK